VSYTQTDATWRDHRRAPRWQTSSGDEAYMIVRRRVCLKGCLPAQVVALGQHGYVPVAGENARKVVGHGGRGRDGSDGRARRGCYWGGRSAHNLLKLSTPVSRGQTVRMTPEHLCACLRHRQENEYQKRKGPNIIKNQDTETKGTRLVYRSLTGDPIRFFVISFTLNVLYLFLGL
jgi:hypothetical protein